MGMKMVNGSSFIGHGGWKVAIEERRMEEGFRRVRE
jgi:hypothetical protein